MNRVPKVRQHTQAVQGFVFGGSGIGQMAFWSCAEDMESSGTLDSISTSSL